MEKDEREMKLLGQLDADLTAVRGTVNRILSTLLSLECGVQFLLLGLDLANVKMDLESACAIADTLKEVRAGRLLAADEAVPSLGIEEGHDEKGAT